MSNVDSDDILDQTGRFSDEERDRALRRSNSTMSRLVSAHPEVLQDETTVTWRARRDSLRQTAAQGRRSGESENWASDAQALAEIGAQIDAGKLTARQVARHFGVDEGTVRRRIFNATGLRWAAYVSRRLTPDR